MLRKAYLYIGAPLLAISTVAHAGEKSPPVAGDFEAVLQTQNSPPQPNSTWRVAGRVQLPKAPTKALDLTTVLPIFLALIGIAGAYWNSVRIEARKTKIAFVNEQLKYLYGPLFSFSHASEAAWKAFRAKHRPHGAFFTKENPPNDDEMKEWVYWIKLVFSPMNEAMVKSIVENAHLIEGDIMPNSFMELIAHVEAYRVVMDKWEKGDFSSYTSLLKFPKDFQSDVSRTFGILKDRQRVLSGG